MPDADGAISAMPRTTPPASVLCWISCDRNLRHHGEPDFARGGVQFVQSRENVTADCRYADLRLRLSSVHPGCPAATQRKQFPRSARPEDRITVGHAADASPDRHAPRPRMPGVRKAATLPQTADAGFGCFRRKKTAIGFGFLAENRCHRAVVKLGR